MDGENLMKEKKKKDDGFCSSNKCIVFFLVLVMAAMGAVVVVTFAVPEVREIHRDPEPEMEWWKTRIVYQIYPRSFQDSDGDGIGDLPGITSRLDYFVDLGVGSIWLSPFYKSPMKDFGYDVSNYTDVEDIFGNMTDFETLIKEAHARDLKVIVDFVPNHSSDKITWFQRSRLGDEKYKDYYIWSDGKNNKRDPPNNWQSVFEGSAWKFDPDRGQYYYHAFLESQPDLNFRNKAVRDEMTGILRFWCDKGVDGFRIDAIPHMFEKQNLSLDEPPGPTNGFNPSLHMYTKNQPEIFDVVKEWRAVLDEYKKNDGKDRWLVAETVGISHEDRLRYYDAGSVPFFFKMIPAKGTCGGTPQCLLDIIRDGINLTEGMWPNFVIGNHDNSRVATRMGPKYADVMNMLLLTLPGTPTTYYGEELGMQDVLYTGTPKDPYAITSHNWNNSRDPERSPMQWNVTKNAGFTTGDNPWLAVNPEFAKHNVQAERENDASSYSIYKSLAEIRRRPAFRSLDIDLPDKVNDVLAYFRGGNSGEWYAVVMNFGTKATLTGISQDYQFGEIELSTMPRAGRRVNLQQVALRPGEGLIIRFGDNVQ